MDVAVGASVGGVEPAPMVDVGEEPGVAGARIAVESTAEPWGVVATDGATASAIEASASVPTTNGDVEPPTLEAVART